MSERATDKAGGAFGAEQQLKRIADLLETLVTPRGLSGETVDVKGAAALLKTTVAAIYTRRHEGKMPRPISRRPLVWRRADLLAMEDE